MSDLLQSDQFNNSETDRACSLQLGNKKFIKHFRRYKRTWDDNSKYILKKYGVV
jgi:hypothetical protein